HAHCGAAHETPPTSSELPTKFRRFTIASPVLESLGVAPMLPAKLALRSGNTRRHRYVRCLRVPCPAAPDVHTAPVTTASATVTEDRPLSADGRGGNTPCNAMQK